LRREKFWIVFLLVVVMTFSFSCSGSAKKEAGEKKEEAKPVDSTQAAVAKPVLRPPAGIVVSVDDHRLSKADYDKEVKANLEGLKGKIPPEKKEEVTKILGKRIIDEFIARSLLKDEADRRGIKASEQEVAGAIDELKRTLPQGVTMEEMLKRNGLTQARLKEEITLGIRIKKLLDQEPSVQAKPSEKEVKEFYEKNKDKFKIPESVHVRHILVASGKDDTEAVKVQKREKIEKIRKELLNGADFAQVAKEKSDCPSKERGGDLGTFTRGQMIKKFEDAAFKQKKGEIGPVVETEFGWHIIQVLDHTPERIQELTEEVRVSIARYLEKQKKYMALNNLLVRLKDKAKIAVAEGF